MKKTQAFLFSGLAFMLVLFASCSSDDDNSMDNDETEVVLELEGKWKFKEINFMDKETVEWIDTLEYNARNTVKYAPYMLGEVWGYDFQTKETDNGYKLDVVQGFYSDYEDDEVLWSWNYNEKRESFSMLQENPAFPPYDFAYHKIKNVKFDEDAGKMTFEATVESRVVGGGFSDTQEVPVEVVLEKGNPTGEEEVNILFEDVPFVTPTN